MDKLEKIKSLYLRAAFSVVPGEDVAWLVGEVERLRGSHPGQAHRVFEDWQKVKSLKRTCTACPSQWEGTLEDGRMIYIRYRHGSMSVSVSPNPTTDVRDAVRGQEVFGGGQSDGFMEDADMFKMTGIRIVEVDNGQKRTS